MEVTSKSKARRDVSMCLLDQSVISVSTRKRIKTRLLAKYSPREMSVIRVAPFTKSMQFDQENVMTTCYSVLGLQMLLRFKADASIFITCSIGHV